jgi:hypothetical protein
MQIECFEADNISVVWFFNYFSADSGHAQLSSLSAAMRLA